MILEQVFAPRTTELLFGHELLYAAAGVANLVSFGGKVVIVTDTHVGPLIADPWISFLREQGVEPLLLTVPAGESSKSRGMKERLEDQLSAHGCTKETLIVALGGGVVSDLTGFLAATYMRGIPLVLIPTSLLGMVDAAIGGKTAVNTSFGKNLIGAYYPPEQILLDTSCLNTLGPKQWQEGAAEIIKYALIRSASLFDKLLTHTRQWEARDPRYIQELIRESVLIKKEVVEADFQEQGYRRILNFGHTIAHALETVEQYQISHGEAVAIGMLIEGHLSYKLGFLQEDELDQIEQVLHLFGFPLQISSETTIEQILAAMRHDKKATQVRPRFVLLEKIGAVVPFDQTYCTEVDEQLLVEALQWYLQRMRKS